MPCLVLKKPKSSRSAEPRLKIWDKNLGQNLGHKFGTDGQTDRRTDRTRYRVALQLKIGTAKKDFSISRVSGK